MVNFKYLCYLSSFNSWGELPYKIKLVLGFGTSCSVQVQKVHSMGGIVIELKINDYLLPLFKMKIMKVPLNVLF